MNSEKRAVRKNKEAAQSCIFCQDQQNFEVFSSKNFKVLLIDAHPIISSKTHWQCAGKIPKELFAELIEVKSKVTEWLKKIYGAVSYYEHGALGKSLPDTGCDHFHLHALLSAADNSPILGKRFQQISMKNYEEILPLFDQYGDYVYFETWNGQKYFYPLNGDMQPLPLAFPTVTNRSVVDS